MVQVVDPVEASKDPLRQLEQLVDDADDEYVPEEQIEQTDEDSSEYDPAAHTPVTAVRPEVAQYDPPGHSKQLVDPVDAS